MKLLSKMRLVLLGLTACYVIGIAISAFVFAIPRVAAAAENPLEKMGSTCNKMERTESTVTTGNVGGSRSISTGTWGECEKLQGTMNSQLGCSDKMFFQKVDPNDASVKLNEWYTNPERYAACFAKAKAKLAVLLGDKCKSMRHGDGVDDSDNWKECEKEQNRMVQALGCTGRMFKPSDKDGYFTQDSGVLDECKARVDAVGNVKILRSDGSSDKSSKDVADAGGYTGAADDGEDPKNQQADCDAKWSSPLSWIICPVIDIGASLSDFVFQDIVSPLLKDVPVSTDRNHPSFKAWEQFRLIANILLIGTLLAVVYSQARGGK